MPGVNEFLFSLFLAGVLYKIGIDRGCKQRHFIIGGRQADGKGCALA